MLLSVRKVIMGVDKEDKILYEDDRNFVDSATFMACQGEGEKMHSASPDKE